MRCFELSGTQTINDVAQALPEVPPASLYRHVKALVAVGALAECGTRQGEKGAPERLYALIDDERLRFSFKGRARTPESLRRLYASVVAAQTAEFERGLRDGAFPAKYFHVRHSLIFVNEHELAEIRAMLSRLAEFTRNPPKGRKALDLGIALFPVKRRGHEAVTKNAAFMDDARRLAGALNALTKSPQFSNTKARAAARQEPAVNWPATKSLNADFNPEVDGCESFVMNDGSTCAWAPGQFRYVAQPRR